MSATAQTPGSTRRRKRTANRRLLELMIDHGLQPNDLAARAMVSGNSVRLAMDGFVPGWRIQKAIADVLDAKPLDIWPWEMQRR